MTKGDAGSGISVIIVAGPTASGKSALAKAIARTVNGRVINADSMQVYRELRIITARPTPEDEAEVPHRLYGVLSAAERCSVGRWRALALTEIEAADAAGMVPVIVGGTGLYIESLISGLSPIPDVSAEARDIVRKRVETHGQEALHHDLARRDPATASRISASDRQRIVRALEVIEATGLPLSHWQSQPAPPDRIRIRPLLFLLMPPRDDLYPACDARFDGMIRQGALEEVAQLNAMRLSPDLPAMRAVGVRELLRHLEGELDLDEAVLHARRATRRYAKRQMTWFRHRAPEPHRLASQFSESLMEEIFPIIHRFLLTA